MSHKITTLVMPPENRQELLGLLEDCGVDVSVARSCQEVSQRVKAVPQLDVVLTSIRITDGTWWDVWQAVK